MKSVNISVVLFFYLYDYFIYGERSNHDVITARRKEKMNRMQLRKLYSDSKTAETEADREAARKEYLDRVGVPEDFRY